MKVCVLRIEGTNCEEETAYAFEMQGFETELVHLNQLEGRCAKHFHRKLSDYDALALPGGWSSGDFVRAGAIFAARLKNAVGKDFFEFVKEKPVIGICNGFQILVETGVLPGFDGVSVEPQAVLATNANSKFECRHTYLKKVGDCAFTSEVPETALDIPVAHAEGRFLFAKKDEARLLERLKDNGQIVFRYCDDEGNFADGKYPVNPNGALFDIAGVCNPEKNVLGMMPHPERVVTPWQHQDWQENRKGDGRLLFKSVANWMAKKK